MKIAVIGAGFVGLAASYYLSRQGISVHIIDKTSIGSGTSGLAAGLLHPYRAGSFLLNWQADVALKKSLQLLDIASSYLKISCYSKSGLLRPITSDKELLSDGMNSDISYFTKEMTEKHAHLQSLPAYFLHNSYTVDCKMYLEGLYTACIANGCTFEVAEINSLDSLSHFDHAIIAAGAFAHSITEAKNIPITVIKGQLLEVEAPPNDPLAYPIFGKGYIIPRNSHWVMGATFERKFSTLDPNLMYAEPALRKMISSFSSYYSKLPVIRCKAGARATTKDHRPLISEIGSRAHCITGFGSRGLLYHALMAEILTEKITAT